MDGRRLDTSSDPPNRRRSGSQAGELDPFLDWLFTQAGLDPGAYQARALQRRLAACLRALRVPSTGAARALLEERRELLPLCVDAALIGVSAFFRDEPVFEQLRLSVLPELLKDRRGLRVCSTGCAEGQELYSIAMLLGELGALEKTELLGIDCRPEAIARARAGCFPEKELETIAPTLRNRYFSRAGGRACVAAELAARMRWVLRDMFAPAQAEPAWDLILFRNVAIYLRAERAARLWEQLANSLSPGGALVTGKAERPPDRLPLRRISTCIYRKVVP